MSWVKKTSHCQNPTSIRFESSLEPCVTFQYLTSLCLHSFFLLFFITMANHNTELRVLELFSGIGGMHYALEGNLCGFSHLFRLKWIFCTNINFFHSIASGISGEVCAAVDINTTANHVYHYNHPDINLLNNNIQKFTPQTILKMNVNTILMSPPCQPFTRVGNKKDIDDARSNALVHICSILPELTAIDFILMENVRGFETSRGRDLYIEALRQSGFQYQEFLLSPTEIGVPNTRYRYYCLARRQPFSFQCDSILERLPNTTNDIECPTIEMFLPNMDMNHNEFRLPDNILLKRAWLLDITYSTSTNTRCFTKAYTHYAEGTGSVYCPVQRNQLDDIFVQIQNESLSSDEKLTKLRSLNLRYFTPHEIAKLMCFPDKFTFPSDTTNKQRYRLLGNSINVAIVSKLIEILYND